MSFAQAIGVTTHLDASDDALLSPTSWGIPRWMRQGGEIMQRSTPSARRQLRGVVELAGVGFDRVTSHIYDFHRAVAALSFHPLAKMPAIATGGRITRAVHDGITAGIYTSVRLAGRALFAAATMGMKALESPAPPVLAPPRSATLETMSSILNGTFGDFIAARRNPLAARLGFYVDGRRLGLTRDALAAAHPAATDRVAIFVHGLWCNEDCWTRYVRPDDAETRPYAQRLADDLGFTSYLVRYNTGLPVTQNGRMLARAIARLVEAHPVPVRDVVLIGHSMGGLVIRAACDVAATRGAAWTHRLSHVICLGTPHLGTPLARAAHLGAVALQPFALTRPIAAILNARSRGIRDLRYSSIADATRGAEPVMGVAGARYHFIGSSIGPSARDPLGWIAGDGLVRLASSTARDVANADTAVVFGAHHLRLVNHPAVYREIRARL